ncbi:hypothetical protein [Entomohabitans teleogrylli]|uniref:hypothetical protein n=1 Tax=Entomohabitans teleogrylli TaxID=1384589 RepID=UPI00073D63A6|nr:hypothetical protein [Entomohabitans teleogrylli]
MRHIAGVALALLFSAGALASKTVDPRDPSIWQEEAPQAQEWDRHFPCEVSSHSGCPQRDDEKSDIQRERERREKVKIYDYGEQQAR